MKGEEECVDIMGGGLLLCNEKLDLIKRAREKSKGKFLKVMRKIGL